MDTAKTAVNSFVVSRIDYCNCLLAAAPQYQLNKLQAVMNSAGRLICGLNKFDHISRVLCDRLPWLPAEQRIQYKLCLLFKAQCGLAPQYPVDFCQPVCQLSVAKADYDRPRVVTSSLSRLRQISKNFFCRGCTTGMELLPENIRNLQSLQLFKSSLKTHLFSLTAWHRQAGHWHWYIVTADISHPCNGLPCYGAL